MVTMKERFPLLAAGALGASGILLGAFGRHCATGVLQAHDTAALWDKAMYFQLIHAAALLGLASWMRTPLHGVAAHRMVRAVRWMLGGIILFSGSLYLFALGGPRGLNWLTPFGGAGLIIGWIYVAGAAAAPRSEYDL